jgi:lipoyl(octanoyl) transferase
MIDIENWGLIDYNEALIRQKDLASEIKDKRNRNVLVLCQHPTVITVGRNGSDNNIVFDSSYLNKLGIKIVNIDRGGDVTMHNEGQLVGYPIFNLQSIKTDLHWFLREIEESLIELLGIYNIKSHRMEGLTGVWVENSRKIAAIGLHCSRWVTSHGFALNVANNLLEFSYIVPCGIKDKGVTSISQENGTVIDIDSVISDCSLVFSRRFS